MRVWARGAQRVQGGALAFFLWLFWYGQTFNYVSLNDLSHDVRPNLSTASKINFLILKNNYRSYGRTR
jgi:hypothetical protein